MKITFKNKEYIKSITLSIVLALIIGAIIMLFNGKNPIEGYSALLSGAFGNATKVSNTMAKTVPLILTGLATAIAFRSGIFNIGGEGQLYLGAFAAAYIGFTFTSLPGIIGIPLAILASGIVGALFAFIPGYLRVRHDVNEVITTIMMNSVAILFTSYLANYPFAAKQGKMGGTDMIAEAYKFKKLINLSQLNTSIFFTIIIALIIWYIMTKTTFGYNLRMVGDNPNFANYGGINAKKHMMIAMLISGALCGIAGSFEVLGTHYRFLQNISKGFAFDGMLVALIVRNNPIGVIFMSIFFGALKTGSIAMEFTTQVPSELTLVLQSIIILFIAAEKGLLKGIKNLIPRRGQKNV